MLELWQKCLEKLESELSSRKFTPWIKPLTFLAYDESEGTLRLGLPNALKLNMVRENFLPIIENAVREQINPDARVLLELIAGRAPVQSVTREILPAAAPETEAPAARPTAAADGADAGGRRPGLYVQLVPNFTFETLVRGKSNQMAVSAALMCVEQPGIAYNPLFLYGGVGLGKTHLLNAIGNAILAKSPRARIGYLHAQTYFDEMVHAIQRRTPQAFKEKYQSLDLLLIDDIQFLGNRERTQEEFFYTFEALFSARKQMVITSDTYPRHLSAFKERLISRFGSGLIMEIEPPELEMRVAILQRKAEQLRQTRPQLPELTDEVAQFLADNVRSNVRELEGALQRTLAFAHFRRLPVSVEVAREASRDLLKQNQLPVSIEQIQKAVADFYKVRIADMYSKRRPANIARARQVAMYLTKEMTSKSFPEIGDAFGGRDHTTVMYAVKRIAELRQQDAELNQQIHLLEQTVRS
ncbi:MAG: chromosomal replication initiator protein DnaA [Burkholderiaceae bacterium]